MKTLPSLLLVTCFSFLLFSCGNKQSDNSNTLDPHPLESETSQGTSSPSSGATPNRTSEKSSDRPLPKSLLSSLLELKTAYYEAMRPVLESLNVTTYPYPFDSREYQTSFDLYRDDVMWNQLNLEKINWNQLRTAHRLVANIDEKKLEQKYQELRYKYDETDTTVRRKVSKNLDPLKKQLEKLKEDFKIHPLNASSVEPFPCNSILQYKIRGLPEKDHIASKLEADLTQRGFLLNAGITQNDQINKSPDAIAERRKTTIDCLHGVIHQAFFKEYNDSLIPCEEIILFKPQNYPSVASFLSSNGGHPENWYGISYRRPISRTSATLLPCEFSVSHERYTFDTEEPDHKISDDLYHEVARDIYKAFVLPLLQDDKLSPLFIDLFNFLPNIPELKNDPEIQKVFQTKALAAGIVDISTSGVSAPSKGLQASQLAIAGLSANNVSWEFPISITLSGNVATNKKAASLLTDIMYLNNHVGIGWVNGFSNEGGGFKPLSTQIENSLKLSYFTPDMCCNISIGTVNLEHVHGTTMEGTRYHADALAKLKYASPFIQVIHREFAAIKDTTTYAGWLINLSHSCEKTHTLETKMQFKLGYNSLQKAVSQVCLYSQLLVHDGLSAKVEATLGHNAPPSCVFSFEVQR